MGEATKHGHYVDGKPSLTYSSWDGMIGRCFRAGNASFPEYGAKGVTVCLEWREFARFLADMGPRPSKAHQIERLDNAKGYEPSNCVWATRSEQARHRRSNLMLTYRGETLPAVVWAERLGFPVHTVWTRKHRGWSDHETLSRPRQNYPLKLRKRG